MKKQSSLHILVTNSLIAALYVAVTFAVITVAYGDMQFRLSEVLNHLVVFNPRYFWGIIGGVAIANLWSTFGIIDVVVGVFHTAISLGLTILAGRFIHNKYVLMWVNTFIFTFTMFIIALLIMGLGSFSFSAFFILWGFLALSEFIVMSIGIFVMTWINKRIPLATLFDRIKPKKS